MHCSQVVLQNQFLEYRNDYALTPYWAVKVLQVGHKRTWKKNFFSFVIINNYITYRNKGVTGESSTVSKS